MRNGPGQNRILDRSQVASISTDKPRGWPMIGPIRVMFKNPISEFNFLKLKIQILMAYVFSRYTERRFIMRSSSYLDLAVFTCVVIWFEQYEVYIHDDNAGFSLTNPPHEYHIFM